MSVVLRANTVCRPTQCALSEFERGQENNKDRSIILWRFPPFGFMYLEKTRPPVANELIRADPLEAVQEQSGTLWNFAGECAF